MRQPVLAGLCRSALFRFVPLMRQALPGCLILLAAVPAAADLCQDLENQQREVQIKRDALKQIHDPDQTARPAPDEPEEVYSERQKHGDHDKAVADALGKLEAELKEKESRFREINRILDQATREKERIEPLDQEIEELRKRRREVEDRIRRGHEVMKALEQRLTANPKWKERNTKVEILERRLKESIALPGKLGLSIGTSNGVLEALKKVENARLEDLELTNHEIRDLEQQIALAERKIAGLLADAKRSESDRREEGGGRSVQAGKLKRELDALRQRLAAARENVRLQVQKDLGTLLAEHNALWRLGSNELQTLKERVAREEELKAKIEGEIDRQKQRVAVEEKRALGSIDYGHYTQRNADGLYGLTEALKSALLSWHDEYKRTRDRKEAVSHYQSWLLAFKAHDEAYRKWKQTREAGNETLSRAGENVNRTNETYRVEMGTLQRGWNRIIAKQERLQAEINNLKTRKAFTGKAEARIRKEWAPYRDQATQIKDRVQQMREQLRAVYQGARQDLMPLHCAAFPEGVNAVSKLDGDLARIDTALGETAGQQGAADPILGSTMAGFTAEPELQIISPDDDAQEAASEKKTKGNSRSPEPVAAGFTSVADSAIKGHNDLGAKGNVTFEECRNACAEMDGKKGRALCKSFEFGEVKNGRGHCTKSTKNRKDIPLTRVRGYTYYERQP